MAEQTLSKNSNHVYVATPIYYVNAKPHLGTLYTTLIADVAKRWHQLHGRKVFFATGTDEHGQKIQEKAEQMGMDPLAFCDSMIPGFEEMWKKYELEYDSFMRTTSPEHKETVLHYIKQLVAQGDIYKSTYTGWYCVPCETFVVLSHDGAKDEDGKPLCASCSRPVKELAEESYFFKLSQYQDRLLAFYEENPDFIVPRERMNEVISFVKSGLKDLSISRTTVSWGIPFPNDPKHTIYVWFDALQYYLSAIGCGRGDAKEKEQCKTWWPVDLHVMGKDIVRFHAVYWPAFLMAVGLPLPKRMLVHGFILMGEHKMSKSRGNQVDPAQLLEWFGVEPVRYYLMRQMPIGQDGQFGLKDLEERVSADLANNLGNLLNRMTVLATNNGLVNIGTPAHPTRESFDLELSCRATLDAFKEAMADYQIHIALAELWKFIAQVNAYFHAMAPWKMAKTDPDAFANVIWSVCQSLRVIGTLLWPIMPTKMETLLRSIGSSVDISSDAITMLSRPWLESFTLTLLPEPLFVRIELPEEEEASEQKSVATPQAAPVPVAPGVPNISIDEFVKVQLVTGTIKTCQPVKGSDKLLQLEVDLGPIGMRQILSGVAKHFTADQLIGKQALFVANLAPRKMMGLESHGMLLMAQNEQGQLRLLMPSGDDVPNGTTVK